MTVREFRFFINNELSKYNKEDRIFIYCEKAVTGMQFEVETLKQIHSKKISDNEIIFEFHDWEIKGDREAL